MIIKAIRKAVAKMGLSSEYKTIYDLQQVQAQDYTLREIEKWSGAYRGYLPEVHDYKVTLVSGRCEAKRRRSMRAGKFVANKMASLCFNERVEIGTDNDTATEYLNSVLKGNGFTRKFQNYLEFMFALGGVAIRVYFAGGKLRLGYTAADAFIPLAHDGYQVTSGVFIDKTKRGKKCYTLLEYHEWSEDEADVYIVRNELYVSESSNILGRPAPLEDLYSDLEAVTEFKGLSRPLFVYLTPNIANNIDYDSELGVSIFADAMDTLESLDIAFDSLQREYRLGKKRIAVPVQMLKPKMDRQTGEMRTYFDEHDEVYQGFAAEEGANANVQDLSVNLRVAEHVEGINALLQILSVQTGFDAGTFTFDGRGIKTATEVVSEDSETYQTRNGHITIIEGGLTDLFTTIFEISQLLGLTTAHTEEFSLNFDDAIVTNKENDSAYWLNLLLNNVVSKKYAMQRILKLTDKETTAMYEEIQGERTDEIPSEFDFTSGEG